MAHDFAYELGAMAHARNYYGWLSKTFAPFLHGTVVEHGSGTGLLSSRLRELEMRLVLVEPDEGFQKLLTQQFAGVADTEVFRGTVEELHRSTGDGSADAVVSANVLEHITEDVECLRAIAGILKPGGHLCLYVPARPELFGTLDQSFDHRRRYGRRELIEKLQSVGLRIVSAQYRNVIGALGWWVSGRLLKKRTLDVNQVRFYDSFVFPVASFLESKLPPPYGQNLLVVAQKPMA